MCLRAGEIIMAFDLKVRNQVFIVQLKFIKEE